MKQMVCFLSAVLLCPFIRALATEQREQPHVLMPRAEDYDGPNAALREALAKDADTWRMIQRETVGNDRRVTLSKGALVSLYRSVCVRVEKDAAEFTLAGGIGYVPVTFTGLTAPTGPALSVDGQKVDQRVHCNDYWQTDYDPAKACWNLTYILPITDNKAHRISFSRTS